MTVRYWPRVLAWASTLLIVAFTLVPMGHSGASELSFCVICGAHGLADILRNILLFLPFGIALGARGRSARRALLTALLFSTGIEVVQLLGLQGRHANPVDVMSNTSGAMLGWLIVYTAPRWALPSPPAARRMALIAMTVAIAVLAGSRALLAPSPTSELFYGQWTADFENTESYGGEVLGAAIGVESIPQWRIEHTGGVRDAFRERSPIQVRFLSGAEPSRLAPLLSIYDDEQMEIFLLGVSRTDLVYRYRTRALFLRLDQPTFRIPGAMAGVRPDEVVRLHLDWDYGEVCATVNGRAACSPVIDARRGWAFLWSPPLGEGVQRFLDHLWVALLFLPLGFWLRGRFGGIAAVAGISVAFPIIFHPERLSGVWAAAVIALLVGHLIARRVMNRHGNSIRKTQHRSGPLTGRGAVARR